MVGRPLPDERLRWAVTILVDALRYRVAASLECAYENLSVKRAMDLLAFNTEDELRAFIRKDTVSLC